jgi:hypothetical protein
LLLELFISMPPLQEVFSRETGVEFSLIGFCGACFLLIRATYIASGLYFAGSLGICSGANKSSCFSEEICWKKHTVNIGRQS